MAGGSALAGEKLFAKLRRLKARDLGGVAAAAWTLCRVGWGLRRRAFPNLLDRLRLREEMPAATPDFVEEASRWVRWAHRLVPLEPNCLLDALAAAALLRRQGFSVPLSIGVKIEQGAFRAHAWLDGGAQDEDAAFRVLYRLHGED